MAFTRSRLDPVGPADRACRDCNLRPPTRAGNPVRAARQQLAARLLGLPISTFHPASEAFDAPEKRLGRASYVTPPTLSATPRLTVKFSTYKYTPPAAFQGVRGVRIRLTVGFGSPATRHLHRERAGRLKTRPAIADPIHGRDAAAAAIGHQHRQDVFFVGSKPAASIAGNVREAQQAATYTRGTVASIGMDRYHRRLLVENDVVTRQQGNADLVVGKDAACSRGPAARVVRSGPRRRLKLRPGGDFATPRCGARRQAVVKSPVIRSRRGLARMKGHGCSDNSPCFYREDSGKPTFTMQSTMEVHTDG